MNKKGWVGLFFAILVILVVVLAIVGGIAYYVMYSITIGEETITIKEKWVKYQGDDAKYLISSENGQVFQITDTLIKWRWDGSNLYASLEEGQTCRIKTQGWRFGFFSDYKNILEAYCEDGTTPL